MEPQIHRGALYRRRHRSLTDVVLIAWRGCRQADRDPRAAIATVAVRLDLAVVLLDEMSGDRQTEAEPAMLASRTTVGLPESIEDERQELRVDTDPRVVSLRSTPHPHWLRSEFRRDRPRA